VNLLRSIDASNTLLRSRWRHPVAYADHDDPVPVLARLLRALLPAAARIGLEDQAFFVGPRRYRPSPPPSTASPSPAATSSSPAAW